MSPNTLKSKKYVSCQKFYLGYIKKDFKNSRVLKQTTRQRAKVAA